MRDVGIGDVIELQDVARVRVLDSFQADAEVAHEVR